MKRTIIAIATILALSSAAQAQYGPYYPDPYPPPVPGPNVWKYGANRWQRDYFEPRYETHEEMCIRTGYCLDPRRPQRPPFEGRRQFDWEYDWED